MKQTLEKTFVILGLLMLLSINGAAQEKKKSRFQEVYTGTIYSMNGGGFSTGFNLSISGYTSDEDARRYLSILAEGDQDDVLKVIKNLELGRLSATGQHRFCSAAKHRSRV